MKITVIIPTYNRVATLPRAIESLLRQGDAADLDILVIDDGSTDATPQVLAALTREHRNVRSVRQDNTGVAGARNAGLAHLLPQTQLVSFLDSDDVSPPGRFAAELPRFLADAALDLTYGRMVLVDAIEDGTLTPPPQARRVDVVGISLSAGIFRRRLIDRIGRFDTTLRQAEDTDYLLRIFETETAFLQTDTLCVFYLRHPGNMTRDIPEATRSFAAAIHKSMQRRRANPSIVLRKPQFALQPLQESGFF